jgi:hypothetical protein
MFNDRNQAQADMLVASAPPRFFPSPELTG